MKKFIFLLILFSLNAFADGKLTNLSPVLSIYSEYYPNPTAKFKGTIIFENGSSTDISEWKKNKKFFNCAKRLGSVFLYDRSGLGKSPPDLRLSANNVLTAELASDNLLSLLKHRNIKPPYILVAHSYGALFSGYFTLKHPDLVKGLLLVDPVPRDFHFPDKHMQKFKKAMDEAKGQSVSFIYKKFGGPKTESIYQLLGFEKTKELIKQLGDINNKIPVIIISSTEMGNGHPLKENWYVSQKQWLNKNPMSKIIQVSSDHFIQLRKPEEVCNLLRQILYDEHT